MRLLIVSQYFWPENFRVNDLACELASRGHEVTVLTGLPNYPGGKIFEEYLDEPQKYLSYKKIRIVRVYLVPRGSSALSLFLNYLSFTISACILGAWKLRHQKFDVVFTCQLSPVTVGLSGAFLAWLKNAPMVMWVLDLWPDTLKAIGIVKSTALLRCVGVLVGFIYKRCDLILAQSRSFIPKIELLAGHRVRVIYFPSWAEDIFKVEALVPAPEVPVEAGIFNIMFAGNIGEAQDFECILSAAVLLKDDPNVRWLIVGDGRMLPWVQGEIERRGLTDSVLILGRHAIERMPEFYLHADAMLVALKNEEVFSMTVPAKLQSYLAAGKPIIAALNGEGADIVREASAGFTCAAGDSQGLADVVRRMADLPEDERLAMGSNALQFCAREFNRKSAVDAMEVHFSSLLK